MMQNKMQNAGSSANAPRMPHKQRGVVLFISLIIIVAMMLTGLAIMRSVGAGTMITANLAFQQSAAASAERGLEYAIAKMVQQNNAGSDYFQAFHTDDSYYPYWCIPASDTNGPTCTPDGAYIANVNNSNPQNPIPSSGADAAFIDNFAATAHNWDDYTKNCAATDPTAATDCNALAEDNAGNRVQWVVQRLCNRAGSYNKVMNCVKYSSTGGNSGCGMGQSCGSDSVGQVLSKPSYPFYRVIVRATGPKNSVAYVEAIVQ